jgi:2-polyprenyl-3-methyl-5-hydroxy-6-metoxy-1,4-benzoquinol methylase
MEKKIKYFSEYRNELKNFYPPCEKLLDVGCGRGVFSRDIKSRYNCIVHGVEFDRSSAEEAAKYLDKVFIGDINSVLPDIHDRYYDIVACNDILEHLYDPYTLLQNLEKKITSDGILISSIPNFLFVGSLFRIIFKRDFKYANEGIMDFTHIRFFTRKSMIRMFNEAGYDVLSLSGINGSNNRLWKLFNFITFRFFDDFSYLQFVITAKSRVK